MTPRILMIYAACMGLAFLGQQVRSPGQVILHLDDRSSGVSDQDGFAGVISLSEEAQTLLARAKAGMERQDWKLVVDSLQRIIDLQGEHVLTSDDRTYVSARRYAHRLVAQLPSEGLKAYRLIHDGEATTLYRQGREARDPRPLRTVIERYLCTSIGDDASILLADWLIDEGRFAEASGLLLNLRDLHPDPDITERALQMRLAVCAAGMGQRRRAESLLSDLHSAATQPSGTGPQAGDNPALADDARERLLAQIEAIREYAAREGDAVGYAGADEWPMEGGSLERQYLMPLVDPQFVTHMPNEVELPLPDHAYSGEVILDYMNRQQLLPVRHVATDGRILVVKGVDRLVAVDIGSFAELWSTDPIVAQSTPDTTFAQQRIIIRNQVFSSEGASDEGDLALDKDPLIWQLLYDSVGSSVCIADHRVLTIDWIHGPAAPLSAPATGRVRGFSPPGSGLDTVPNQVVAYSAHDGSLLWKSQTQIEGAEGGAAAGFEEVEFLAVPIPVGESLLAPARVNTDLYALLLDAETGRLQRRVYLCGTGGGPFESLHALMPCVADGVAYIPSGRGLLFALDLDSWSVRWTVRYEASEQAYKNRGWIPQPTVAVSDVVLLAPADSDRLYCFGRTDGVLRWDMARQASRYILAATDRHLWLVGDTVQRISVETGETLNEVSVPEISGRGVLSGERIYLPTHEGIVSLDAESLERLAVEHIAGSRPAGNLLAWNASLFSTDAFNVHRYVDVERGYAQALAKYGEDPADASRAIALAWMELHREAPDKAFETLASVAEPTGDEDKLLYESVVNLRVSALLDWAASGMAGDDKAIELLRRARDISRTTEDIVRSILALGDHYERLDQRMTACREYASLALSDHGDEMYKEEGATGLERLARREASLRLSDAWRNLSETERSELESVLRREHLEPAVAERDRTQLRRIADTVSMGAIASEAELILGRWMAAASRFEQAEAHLHRVIRANQSDALVAEAMGWLAAMYLFPRDFHLPVQASQLLDQLERRYADVDLPANILLLHAMATDAAQAELQDDRLIRARELAARLREQIDPEILADHRQAFAPFGLGMPQEPRVRSLEGRPLTIRQSRIEPMANLVLMLVDENEIEAHDADTWRVVWPAKLRLLGEMAVEPERVPNSAVRGIHQQRATTLAYGVVDGQTLIVNSEFGLHAVGLLTGRRLWSRPYHPPNRKDYPPAGSDASVWAHRGYIITVNARGQLEVAHADQGHRIQWRASVPMRRWQRVLSRGDYVVVTDELLERLDVFRLEDGRRLGECVFVQDPDPKKRLSISVYDEVVCGPASPTEVVAYELARPGVERWRVRMPEPVSRIFKPASDLLAVADIGGRLKIIDPVSGQLQMETHIKKNQGGVFCGAIDNGVMYVGGFEESPWETKDYDLLPWYVAAVDMRSGRVMWLEDGFSGVPRHMTSELFTAATNVIPVVQFLADGRDRQNTPAGRVTLTLLDKETGNRISDEQTRQISRDADAQWILDVQVWADKIIVLTGSSVVVYPLEVEQPFRQNTRTKERSDGRLFAGHGGTSRVAWRRNTGQAGRPVR